jgi:hypothetical protein
LVGDERDVNQSKGGRFRPEIPGYTVIDNWQWDQSPVSNSYAMGGLVVAMMMINNWDLKTSNNKLYEVIGGGGSPRRLYVARDLGARHSDPTNKQNGYAGATCEGLRAPKTTLRASKRPGSSTASKRRRQICL